MKIIEPRYLKRPFVLACLRHHHHLCQHAWAAATTCFSGRLMGAWKAGLQGTWRNGTGLGVLGTWSLPPGRWSNLGDFQWAWSWTRWRRGEVSPRFSVLAKCACGLGLGNFECILDVCTGIFPGQYVCWELGISSGWAEL